MRILVRTPNWLGDAVMCTPFLNRLVAQNPGAEIDLLCRPSVSDVFRGLAGIRDILPLPRSAGLWSTACFLRERRYQRAYILPASFNAALPPWLAGIPERIGHPGDFRGPLLTRVVPLDERFHYIRRYLSLIGEPGRDIHRSDLYFPSAASTDAEGQALGTGRILAVAPGSRAEARRWFPERFAAVIDGLGEGWGGVVLVGAPEDRPQAERVAALTRRKVTNLCGRTTLPELAGVLDRCDALVTNESGLMHVGWARGLPLVVVAGPSEPQATSPFGPNIRVIQHREIPCVPCVRNNCDRAGIDFQACLKAITVNEVLSALNALAPI